MFDSLFFIDISQVSIKSWDPTVNFTLYFGSHKVNNFNVDLYLDYLLIDILFLIYTYDKNAEVVVFRLTLTLVSSL